jgi:hypothetical protein
MFDVVILIANLLLVSPLTDLVRDTQGYHPMFAWFLLVAVFAHAAGAWLKRVPLQLRLMQTPAWGGGAFALFLMLGVMHLGVFLACTSLALEVLALPAPALPWVLFSIGLLPTFCVVRALIPLRAPATGETAARVYRERVADALLCLSTILILVWWEAVFVESVAGRGQNMFMSLLLVLLMSVPFAIFYLAPRMLFLAEDFQHKKTWGMMLVVVLPLAWRLVNG